ncbi:MAG: purine-nucleoside phosphorylase, partial [Myxococcota bacterium]
MTSALLVKEHIEAAAAAVRAALGLAVDAPVARVGVVLGSGLGRVADEVCAAGGTAIEYGAIPHFPTSAVEGHRGRLVYGHVDHQPVLLMQGRVHRYEGW